MGIIWICSFTNPQGVFCLMRQPEPCRSLGKLLSLCPWHNPSPQEWRVSSGAPSCPCPGEQGTREPGWLQGDPLSPQPWCTNLVSPNPLCVSSNLLIHSKSSRTKQQHPGRDNVPPCCPQAAPTSPPASYSCQTEGKRAESIPAKLVK